ncbi:MAG: NAD(P)-dependent oxidoreductase [Phycisphaerales bacterium]
MNRPIVVVAEEISAQSAAWLSQRCDLRFCSPTDASFPDHLRAASGLIVRTYTRVDESLLAGAPSLRVVGRAGVGLDNIDVPACRARGVEVVHTPDANSDAVAQFVFTLLLGYTRPISLVAEPLPLPCWRELRLSLRAPRQIDELTFGILGLGRIGSRVARIAAAMGASVVYHDVLDIPESKRWGAQPVGMRELLARADVLTLHTDPRPSNHGLVNRNFLAGVKPDVILINTSRGIMVNNADLAEFLREHPEATALLDVHHPEPFGPDYPLLGLANARLTPHIAAGTTRSDANMSRVVEDVWRVLSPR